MSHLKNDILPYEIVSKRSYHLPQEQNFSPSKTEPKRSPVQDNDSDANDNDNDNDNDANGSDLPPLEPFEIISKRFSELLTKFSDNIIKNKLDRKDYQINFFNVDWAKKNKRYRFDDMGRQQGQFGRKGQKGQKEQRWKCHTLKAKSKFKCSQCRDSKWTSSGTTFQFLTQQKFRQTSKSELKNSVVDIEFIVRVWSQNCTQCQSLGNHKSYEDETIRLGKIVVGNILKGYFKELREKQKVQKGSGAGRESNMTSGHKPELCEACIAGICKSPDEKDMEELLNQVQMTYDDQDSEEKTLLMSEDRVIELAEDTLAYLGYNDLTDEVFDKAFDTIFQKFDKTMSGYIESQQMVFFMMHLLRELLSEDDRKIALKTLRTMKKDYPLREREEQKN